MEVEFALTRKEHEEFFKLTYARIAKIGNGNVKFFFINIIVWGFFGISFASAFSFYEDHEWLNLQNLNIALIFFGIGILGFIATSIYQKRFYLHYSLHNKGITLQRQRVTLTDHAIVTSTETSTQTYSWRSVQDFEQTDNLLCLYIDNCLALLIPKRALPESDALKKATDLLYEKTSVNK